MKEIKMLKSYKWFDGILSGGATYKIGSMPNGHELNEKRAKRLIAGGWAEEVV
ncbi:MAG: hypothetical protein WC124_01985 [Desulfoplanes sp.]